MCSHVDCGNIGSYVRDDELKVLGIVGRLERDRRNSEGSRVKFSKSRGFSSPKSCSRIRGRNSPADEYLDLQDDICSETSYPSPVHSDDEGRNEASDSDVKSSAANEKSSREIAKQPIRQLCQKDGSAKKLKKTRSRKRYAYEAADGQPPQKVPCTAGEVAKLLHSSPDAMQQARRLIAANDEQRRQNFAELPMCEDVDMKAEDNDNSFSAGGHRIDMLPDGDVNIFPEPSTGTPRPN